MRTVVSRSSPTLSVVYKLGPYGLCHKVMTVPSGIFGTPAGPG